MRFIPPAVPVLKQASPIGPDWLHEVKFDGWRLQIHRQGDVVRLYSRRGIDMANMLAHKERDIRELPLIERREALREVLIETDDDTLRFSEEFPDPVKLLQVAGRLGHGRGGDQWSQTAPERGIDGAH